MGRLSEERTDAVDDAVEATRSLDGLPETRLDVGEVDRIDASYFGLLLLLESVDALAGSPSCDDLAAISEQPLDQCRADSSPGPKNDVDARWI